MSSRLRATGRSGSMCECGSMIGMWQISAYRSWAKGSCSTSGLQRGSGQGSVQFQSPPRQGEKAYAENSQSSARIQHNLLIRPLVGVGDKQLTIGIERPGVWRDQ